MSPPDAAEPVEADARPARVVAVLGMHRSGTSAVVGSLQQRGLFLGRHNTRNRWNPRGNRENPDVVRLNEDVLAACGGSWNAPPAEVDWQPAHLERARGLLAEYAGRPLWGFKDPRTLLTLAGWRRLVPDVEFVGVFRHPARVARSLAGRPGLTVADPLELWRVYNERLHALRREREFPLISFDEGPAELQRSIDRAAEFLRLGDTVPAEPFFTEELRRTDAEPGDLPAGVAALYEKLRALAA